MAGQGGLNGNGGGFTVADFTNHHHVRVLAQNGTQRIGKIQPDLAGGLDLVDAADLIFNRVFHGQNLAVYGIQAVQRRIQRGGLTTARRASDQKNPVGLVQHRLKVAQVDLGQTNGVQLQVNTLLVENPHHHALTVHGRHSGDTQVNRAALQAQLDTAILGQAALGNIQFGKNFQAGNNRRGQLYRRGLDLLQYAVNPEANGQVMLERLDMNVRGAGVQRTGKNTVDQPNHRRFRRHIAQALDIVNAGCAFNRGQLFLGLLLRSRTVQPLVSRI